MTITDEKLRDWTELAKRDDCFDRLVPSDLRVILGELTRARAALTAAAQVGKPLICKACGQAWTEACCPTDREGERVEPPLPAGRNDLQRGQESDEAGRGTAQLSNLPDADPSRHKGASPSASVGIGERAEDTPPDPAPAKPPAATGVQFCERCGTEWPDSAGNPKTCPTCHTAPATPGRADDWLEERIRIAVETGNNSYWADSKKQSAAFDAWICNKQKGKCPSFCGSIVDYITRSICAMQESNK